jgi:capsular polysaccharide transport system permease protein
MSDTQLRDTQGSRLRFATGRAIMALVLRQMSAKYGRNPGGYIWAILEPAIGIIFLTAIFSAGFRTPSLGTNFAIFYASGFLPYEAAMKTSSGLMTSLKANRNLLTFPRVTLVDAMAAQLILDVLTQLLVSYLLFTAILFLYDTRTILVMPYLIQAYVMAIALGFGIGTLNCFLVTRYPLWRTAWGILTRPLVLISGVIFLHEKVPEPFRTWLEWNPLVHVTGQARKAFYISYEAKYVDMVYVFMIAGVTAVVGALFLGRYYRETMEKL